MAPPGSYNSTSGALFETTTQIAPAASDTLEITNPGANLNFTMQFTNNPVAPGGTATAAFTIENPDSVATASGLGFTMPVDGFISCGATVSDGTSLTMSGGSLGPGDTCSFAVNISIPSGASTSKVVFTTAALDVTVNSVATTVAAASDMLQVQQQVPSRWR
ncbi:hypothetical protein [Breoghania sp.]|uniref:hypothetical protein n=1 Tax=Breoghania sp. TaxID=2065378 RepID=UPI0026250D24|nr:hypothetical protein [Breoghania sp.]MDJ0931097.1 hypothetical protein [Breoghania sp.]